MAIISLVLLFRGHANRIKTKNMHIILWTLRAHTVLNDFCYEIYRLTLEVGSIQNIQF
jgi:hypothetical protein